MPRCFSWTGRASCALNAVRIEAFVLLGERGVEDYVAGELLDFWIYIERDPEMER